MGRDGSNPRVIATDENFFDYHYGRTFGYPTGSPDGAAVFFRSHRSGWITYWAVSPDGGEPRQLAPQEADQEGGAWSQDGAWFAYTSNTNGTVDLRVVPSGGGEARVLVAPEVGVVSHPQWSPDGTRISYLLATPTSAADLYVVTVADGSVTRLTDSTVGATARMLAAPEKITYPSVDGETIHAYLYRPEAIGVKPNGAGVVFVHGGPTSQFSDTLQLQVQFFVGRGYSMLLPNPRGSTGYGRRFEDLNNADWGYGDLQDVIFGAEELKKLPGVDPGKMAVTGTSYGGIMSMAAVSFAPGYFQASIPMSGYGDFVHMKAEQELRHVKLLEYEFGTLEEHPEVRGGEGDDPVLRLARRRPLPGVRGREGVCAGPGARVQDLQVQDLPGRDVLRCLDRERAPDAARHGRVLPAVHGSGAGGGRRRVVSRGNDGAGVGAAGRGGISRLVSGYGRLPGD
jgi:dipeptidyl aminopeptidase/acylaminoacyl peptidase